MSESENVWRKRTNISITCPSGQVSTVRRPGPDLALKAGKIARMFQRQKTAATTDVNKQLEFIESLSDDELDKLTAFARVLLADVVIQPSLSLHPKEGQFGPDDLPIGDFWFLFIGAMNGWPDMPVKLTEGETTVEAVNNFPSGQSASPSAGEDSEVIQ